MANNHTNASGLVVSLAAVAFLQNMVGGAEQLEFFLEASPSDKLSDVFDTTNPMVAALVDKHGPDSTVADLVAKLEEAVVVTENVQEEQQGEESEQPQENNEPQQPNAPAEVTEEPKLEGNGVEIASTEAAPAAPAVEEPEAPTAEAQQPARAPAPAADPVVSEEPEWFASLSVLGKTLKQQFDQYVKDMRPRMPLAGNAAARNQVILYRTLITTVNQGGADFQQLWSYFLSKFHELGGVGGVFHEHYLFREFEQLQLSDNEVKAFSRLLNLLKVTADPKGRQAVLRQVDLANTTKYAVAENGRQNIMKFYG